MRPPCCKAFGQHRRQFLAPVNQPGDVTRRCRGQGGRCRLCCRQLVQVYGVGWYRHEQVVLPRTLHHWGCPHPRHQQAAYKARRPCQLTVARRLVGLGHLRKIE